MSERKWHPVIGSSVFKPGIGRFERGEVIIMIFSLGFGLVMFRFLSASVDLSIWPALLLASVFPVGAGTFLLCFVTGKPRHYASDMLAWQWMRLACWLSNHGFPVKSKPLIEIESNERNIS
jgi:hypothetical protein